MRWILDYAAPVRNAAGEELDRHYYWERHDTLEAAVAAGDRLPSDYIWSVWNPDGWEVDRYGKRTDCEWRWCG